MLFFAPCFFLLQLASLALLFFYPLLGFALGGGLASLPAVVVVLVVFVVVVASLKLKLQPQPQPVVASLQLQLQLQLQHANWASLSCTSARFAPLPALPS